MESSSNRTEQTSVSTFDALTPKLGILYTWLLVKFGYRTLQDLKKATVKDLMSIPGIGASRLGIILEVLESFESNNRNSRAFPAHVYP